MTSFERIQSNLVLNIRTCILFDSPQSLASGRLSPIAWLEVTGHMQGAYDFRFGKRQGNRGCLAGLYVASGVTPSAGFGVEYDLAEGSLLLRSDDMPSCWVGCASACSRCTVHHIHCRNVPFRTSNMPHSTYKSQCGFTLVEVLVSFVSLAVFSALAYGLPPSARRQTMRGNKQVELGHVTRTAVEHFKTRVRAEADVPSGGCREEGEEKTFGNCDSTIRLRGCLGSIEQDLADPRWKPFV